MATDNGLEKFENQNLNNANNLQQGGSAVSDFAVEGKSLGTKTELPNSAHNDKVEIANKGKEKEIDETETEGNTDPDDDGLLDLSQYLKTYDKKAGKRVPLMNGRASNCPPQYRLKSDGAIYGAGYDAEIMQDSTRSVRTRKLVRLDGMLDDFEEDVKKPMPKWLKITIAVLTSIVAISSLLGIYILYVGAGYKRVYDVKYIEILNDQPATLAVGIPYEVVSYNLNYGMISSDYTYYKNIGYDVNGNQIVGSSSRAESKDRVEVNTKGSAGLLSTGSNAEAEFVMVQEIDLDSTRTYYVDELAILNDVFANYAKIFVETGSSNYVFYPLTSPVGKFSSGMMTYSAFNVAYGIRHTMPSDETFPAKYTTADNCISITRCKVAGIAEQRYLCLFNVNISLYESEEIRVKCLERLYDLMKTEIDRGHFVLVGGSFSYALCGNDGVFENNMKTPDWCKDLPGCFSPVKLSEIGCRIIKDEVAIELKTGTTRDASVKYKKGETFEAITDGFIVSNNIVVNKIEVLDNEFLYSSHNPIRLSFYLK